MIKSLLGEDDPVPDVERKPPPTVSRGDVLHLFDSDDSQSSEEFVISRAEPESATETIRRSGMAWSAGIAFFAAVVFMLILGWGADLLLGTSPWGIVGGIVLGSIIGFVQFFRITSQIFKK
jgi:F0F1-type ATP synthase assembly protein I